MEQEENYASRVVPYSEELDDIQLKLNEIDQIKSRRPRFIQEENSFDLE